MSGGSVSPEEERAFAIIESVVGTQVTPTDVAGARPGSLDGRIDFTDGRVGVVEVSTLGTSREFHLADRMRKVGGHFEAPGDWAWVIGLSDVAEFERVRSVCSKVILICEKHRVHSPSALPADVIGADLDLDWLVHQTRTNFFGVMLPDGARDAEARAHLHVLQTVASWDRGRDGLLAGLNDALHRDPLVKRMSKLAAAPGEERHLFLAVTIGGLYEATSYDLIMHSIRPEEAGHINGDPDVPHSVTDLWLDVGWGSRVTRWTRGLGWSDPHFDLSA
ncbi:MAG TPA: hypothetical protein VGM94_11815 [Galbitalea sp.]|jgi:hypothetical protein